MLLTDNLKIAPLCKQDMEEAILVMRESFNGSRPTISEPIFDWLAGPEISGKSTDPRRLRFMSWLMKQCFKSGIDNGALILGGRSTRSEDLGTLVAVCIVSPPGLAQRANPTIIPEGRKFWRRMHKMGVRAPEDRFAKLQIREVGKIFSSICSVDSKEDHFYVNVMAVSPLAQGRGCCQALLEAVAWMADRHNKMTYIETRGKRNIDMLHRLGYHVQSQHKVIMHGEDQMPAELLTAMARQPELKSPFEDHASPFDRKTVPASEKNSTAPSSEIRVVVSV